MGCEFPAWPHLPPSVADKLGEIWKHTDKPPHEAQSLIKQVLKEAVERIQLRMGLEGAQELPEL